MKKLLSAFFLTSLSIYAYADMFAMYRNPDGSTKWQWVANTTLSVLILSLSTVAVFLFLAYRRAGIANRELTDIKITLEERVAERTVALVEAAENLKNSEAYIASVIERMPLMLIGLNKNLEIIQWNHVAETATGRSFSNVRGKNLWEVYPTITLTPEQVKDVLATQKTTVIKHGQRDQYYFDLTLYALTDKHETSVVILVDDITKQMKAELKVSERDKVSAMGELASAMAYDIQLPLEAISSSVESASASLITSNNSDLFLAKNLQDARSSSAQASAIIQNLLDLANSHADEKDYIELPITMDKSIAVAKQLFSSTHELDFQQIEIQTSYATNLRKAYGFNAELEQVFVRLLRNAYHALKDGKPTAPRINIEISEFYDSLWIKVQHNGKLLNALEQEDIFQPYFSISDRPPACPVEQRLSYSYFIITDHHDGQMSVTSEANTGTTFNIQLPVI